MHTRDNRHTRTYEQTHAQSRTDIHSLLTFVFLRRYCNDTAVDLVKVLDLGLARFTSSSYAKVAATAADVQRMLT